MDEEDQEMSMLKQKSSRRLGEGQEEIDVNNPNEIAYHR